MFQPKISKEEVNLLPVEEFSGKIHVIDSSKKLKINTTKSLPQTPARM